MMFLRNANFTGIVIFITLPSFGQNVLIPWPEITDSTDYVDTRSVMIVHNMHKTVFLDTLNIWFSTDFPGARANAYKQVNDSILELSITPENAPINMSPWYAFRLWTNQNKRIIIRLKYAHGTHRYPPRISHDGILFNRMDPSMIHVNDADSSAMISLQLDGQGIWVSAQELITSRDNNLWINALAEEPFIQSRIIGYSHYGNPILALEIGPPENDDLLVILGRQHPPELTGYLEMVRFIETICSQDRMARKFRKNFRILAVPMMNPDGVDQGHWRHNIGGVDLNRDWRFFNQPETYAFRKYILNQVDTSRQTIWFAVDFHSTQTDLFYLHREENMPDGETVALGWLQQINTKFPDTPFNPEPTGMTAQISKNWFWHELKTEAVTYEVGDQTSREIIHQRGSYAARVLMKLLLKEIK